MELLVTTPSSWLVVGALVGVLGLLLLVRSRRLLYAPLLRPWELVLDRWARQGGVELLLSASMVLMGVGALVAVVRQVVRGCAG